MDDAALRAASACGNSPNAVGPEPLRAAASAPAPRSARSPAPS